MKKRVGDVEEFGFEVLTDEPDVHVTIAVTGWLTEDEPGDILGVEWVVSTDSK